MDYESLIADLQEISQNNIISIYKRSTCAAAATALSTLQAENEKLRAENNMLRRMQPVELNGESARSLSLALEASQLREELERANKKFPQFHSDHEGWAVIQEEIEECGDELTAIFEAQKEAWEEIRADKKPNVNIAFVYGHAINLACEAIQVAAMCKKFLNLEGNP